MLEKLLLTAKNVTDVFLKCMFTEEEVQHIEATGDIPKDAVLIEGIAHKIGFQKGKLDSNKEAIKELLSQLPTQFMYDPDNGGWSFLNASFDKDGKQWGEHGDAEMLLCMGMAIKVIKPVLPRELWHVLPGKVPYYVIKLDGFNDSEVTNILVTHEA